jgi:hypothetical protein
MLILALAALACTGTDETPVLADPLPDACEIDDATAVADSGDTALDSGDSGGDSGPGSPWLSACEVLDVPALVTARQVRLELAEPGAVRLCCTHQSEPSEVHVVSTASATEHLLTLHGLLPQTNYECVADVTSADGERQVALTLSTEPLPDWIRLPELTGEPSASSGAYTLVNHFVDGKNVAEQKLLIFDRHGGVRWYLDLRDDITAVDATWIGDGTLLYGGGFGGAPTLVDLEGQTVFEGGQPTTGTAHHHDVEPLPSGRIASLVTNRVSQDGSEWTGFGVEIIDVPSGDLAWSYDSQLAVDSGDLPSGSGDPWHANALQVVERDGVIEDVWVNLRDINRLIRLDPETQAITTVVGPDGNYTLVDDDGDPQPDDAWFDFPHAPEVRGDRILFYDNRNNQPDSDTSRAVEFTLDPNAGTAHVSWEWSERNFREQAWGDVDTLDSGDVLVTIAHCEHCELSDDKSRSAVVEVERATGDVLWRLTWPDATDGLYRADRIAGCDVFANARYCPTVLSE